MLVDCNASMLTPTADFPEGALSAFLASCAATMKEKIVGNSTDLVSIGMNIFLARLHFAFQIHLYSPMISHGS